MKPFFVTGCGTDIGKTFITTALLRACQQRGKQVDALKPVLSGELFGQDDASALLRALTIAETQHSRDVIAPYRFAAPLSPHHAATLEGRTITAQEVTHYCKDYMQRSTADILFIEGAGGVAVPINQHQLMIDIMAALHIPIIFITSDYLGSISHSVTALNLLYAKNIAVHSIIINQSPHSVGLDAMHDTLTHFSPYLCPIFRIMRSDEASVLQQGESVALIDRICNLADDTAQQYSV